MNESKELALKLAVDVGQYRMLPEDRIVEIAERFASFLENPMASAKSPDPKREPYMELGSGIVSTYLPNMEE